MIVSSKSLGDPIDQGKVLIGLYIPKLSPCLKMEVYLEGKYFENTYIQIFIFDNYSQISNINTIYIAFKLISEKSLVKRTLGID